MRIIKQEERYLELSKKIKECADEIKKLKLKGDDKDIIRSKREEINNKTEKIKKEILTIIGQMYKGIFINGELSIREDNKIYKYKCQYELDCPDVIQKIKENFEETKGKLGEEKFKIIEVLCRISDELNNLLEEEKGKSQIKEELKIEPPLSVAVIRDYNDDVDLKTINKIIIDRGGISFKDSEGNSVYIYDYEKVVELNFKDEIKKMRQKILESYAELDKDLDKLLNEIEEKGGKYLIASKL